MSIPLLYQFSCFRMVGNKIRPLNSMSVDPSPRIICCEVSSFITRNAVWDTVTVDKALTCHHIPGWLPLRTRCWWQIGHLVIDVPKLAWVSGSPCYWDCASLPPLPPRPLFLSASWAMTGVPGERSCWYTQNVPSHSLFQNSPLLRSPFGEHSHETLISTFSVHSERSIHILLFQPSLSPVFQSCSSWVSDHPAKPRISI